MVSADNFIFFLTVCGFFIGLIFSLLTGLEPLPFVWTTISLCAVFYMIALASAAFFIKAINVKSSYTLDTAHYEIQLDKARDHIEKREEYIRDSTLFIRMLEAEILANKEEAAA